MTNNPEHLSSEVVTDAIMKLAETMDSHSRIGMHETLRREHIGKWSVALKALANRLTGQEK